MKITPEDLDAIRDVVKQSWNPRGFFTLDAHRDAAISRILARVYNRGYAAGHIKARSSHNHTEGE